ncbi:MAG: hypothetical protein VB859_13170, partial [Planctomycetaceae bacterium]
VKISYMLGGDEYLKVARSLLKSQDATDEEIASSTGLRINIRCRCDARTDPSRVKSVAAG